MSTIANNRNKKVYRVTFGELLGGQDYHNVEHVTVVSVDADQAIRNGTAMLSRGKRKTYYVESVDLRDVISQ